jgi:N-hydroxyarylamine O-acetyltransferase
MSDLFNLAGYLRRIGVEAAGAPTLALLQALHRAHVCAIPFENLDVQMGLPIRLDIGSLQAKLVDHRRGGYCFEQNTLFLHALRGLGFEAIACEARVRSGATSVLARTHMLLIVTIGGREWVCDVGFGTGLFEPVPLDGGIVPQLAWRCRIGREGPLCLLQSQRAEAPPTAWDDLYAFEPAERYPVDFEMGNWYTSTWPESRFILTLTAQQSTREGRQVLRNFTFTDDRGGQHVSTRTIERGELVPLLRTTFGLDVPLDARFRALD